MCRHPFTPSPSRVIFQMGPAWTYGCKTYGPIRLLLLLNLFLFLGVQQLSSGTEGRRIEKSRFSKRCPCSKNMRKKKNTHAKTYGHLYDIIRYHSTYPIYPLNPAQQKPNETGPSLRWFWSLHPRWSEAPGCHHGAAPRMVAVEVTRSRPEVIDKEDIHLKSSHDMYDPFYIYSKYF